MEFRLNAMEISLKKVLGYRFYERHKRFISVKLLENIAVVILICSVSIFISNASVGIALDVYKRQINEDVVLSLVSEMLKAIAEYAKHDRACLLYTSRCV